eukprot:TRINITY_DN96138_c0_g1_i1.p1 TRINITY_DN96138_c0_g1~~TRINITY_DN96138_c0_g1_i1.p1  ORF type:complete len:276 (-),score=53.92 TRINITY_DN96138_c0_g1_i1:63-890(-)
MASDWWTHVARSVSTGSTSLVERVTSSAAIDGIPLASQGKSLLQAVSGDLEGARRTQDSFTKRCVGVSQIRSTFEFMNGDRDAAEQTQAEFSQSMREADQAAHYLARKVTRTTDDLAERVRPVVERALDSELAARAEEVVQRAGEAVQPLAEHVGERLQEVVESEWGRKFAHLLRMRGTPSSSSASRGCGAVRQSSGGTIESLDDCTILARASQAQSGAECSCCLEEIQVGEAIRVLPCFHTLHDQCAAQWLLQQPVCPVCRCDLVTSLEAHRRS